MATQSGQGCPEGIPCFERDLQNAKFKALVLLLSKFALLRDFNLSFAPRFFIVFHVLYKPFTVGGMRWQMFVTPDRNLFERVWYSKLDQCATQNSVGVPKLCTEEFQEKKYCEPESGFAAVCLVQVHCEVA
jgi:hypothetical protein